MKNNPTPKLPIAKSSEIIFIDELPAHLAGLAKRLEQRWVVLSADAKSGLGYFRRHHLVPIPQPKILRERTSVSRGTARHRG